MLKKDVLIALWTILLVLLVERVLGYKEMSGPALVVALAIAAIALFMPSKPVKG